MIAQALEDPSLLDQSLHGGRRKQSKLDLRDLSKVTSRIAIREIWKSREYAQAQVDLSELWIKYTVAEVERDNENTVEELAATVRIEEDGYWYCCPFNSFTR